MEVDESTEIFGSCKEDSELRGEGSSKKLLRQVLEDEEGRGEGGMEGDWEGEGKMGTVGGRWHAAKVPPVLKKVFVWAILGPVTRDSSFLKAETSSTDMSQWSVSSFSCMVGLL